MDRPISKPTEKDPFFTCPVCGDDYIDAELERVNILDFNGEVVRKVCRNCYTPEMETEI